MSPSTNRFSLKCSAILWQSSCAFYCIPSCCRAKEMLKTCNHHLQAHLSGDIQQTELIPSIPAFEVKWLHVALQAAGFPVTHSVLYSDNDSCLQPMNFLDHMLHSHSHLSNNYVLCKLQCANSTPIWKENNQVIFHYAGKDNAQLHRFLAILC